jgi:hypothetical protein
MDDLAPMLLHDEVDLAVDCAVPTHRSLVATRLFREKFLIVASQADHSCLAIARTCAAGMATVPSTPEAGSRTAMRTSWPSSRTAI